MAALADSPDGRSPTRGPVLADSPDGPLRHPLFPPGFSGLTASTRAPCRGPHSGGHQGGVGSLGRGFCLREPSALRRLAGENGHSDLVLVIGPFGAFDWSRGTGNTP